MARYIYILLDQILKQSMKSVNLCKIKLLTDFTGAAMSDRNVQSVQYVDKNGVEN